VTLTFGLPRAAMVDLAIFDATGRRVRQLVRGLQPAGEHAVAWDRPGADGSEMGSGVYFCRLKVEGSSQTIVLTRVR
jgi:flagellar hook assembly protein FlgD